jgi:hypothetical protein
MFKRFITLFCMLFSLMAYGQEDLINPLSDKHIPIRGSKISLIPPDNFTVSNQFFGLQQIHRQASIMVIEIPTAFALISQALNKKNLLSSGFEVHHIETIRINGLPAMLIKGEQRASGVNYAKYTLAFGSEKESILIHGVCPAELQNLAEEIKTSMLSVVFDKDKVVNALEELDYTVDVSETDFKFASIAMNSIIFNLDGSMANRSDTSTNFMITKSFAQVNTIDKKGYTLNRLKQYPYKIEKIESIEEVTIDGLQGYAIEAKGSIPNTSRIEQLYHVMLFSDQMYFLFFGNTLDTSGKRISEMKKVIRTFQRR